MFNQIRIQLKKVLETASIAPVLFAILWTGSFLFIFGALLAFDVVPSALKGEETEDTVVEVTADTENASVAAESGDTAQVLAAETSREAQTEDPEHLPTRIVIDAVGVDVEVQNPASTDPATLDNALLEGVAHYPGSGDLEDVSNMFLFGHSSYLPGVINRNYQAFNGIQNLEAGDVIRVQSASKEYIYTVRGVKLVSADDAWVEFSSDEKTLTLSTCDVFGKKQDRYVVEADFVGAYVREA